jgi:Protein of unknown function (DUF2905)
MDSLGKTIVLVGLILVATGLLLWGASSVSALSRIPLVSRLGRLPGDVYVQRGNFTLYFPITTSIVVSIVLTVIFAALRR